MRKRLPFTSVLLLTAVASTVTAQSSRPGQGATIYQDDDGWGTTFRTWAPHASAAYVSGTFNNWATNTHPLVSEGDGFWSMDAAGVWAGHEYQFVMLSSGNTLWRNDPHARKLTSSNGKSIIVNPDQFDWQHDMVMPNWNELVIYEMHTGTFGVVDGGGFPGNFVGIQAHLDHLESLGINAIELLPVNEFAGDQSWGYNPGHIFAVESYYGGPDQLKQLIDACHERGIAVLIDVVFNHLGPDDLGCW
ncbi:MAG: alpha-amylase family glycosyl hydrolase, partial [Phycisphaerales bacterium]|nr:alpha-amylase family glycosyl hydrolase [Phycisphaerales bacterium]